MTIKLFITMAKNPDDAAEAIEEFISSALYYKNTEKGTTDEQIS